MNIAQLFFAAAKQYPLKTAIIEKDKSISFGELHTQVGQTAQYFSNSGISKGDRVLVFVPMGIDLYRIVLALFSLGATAVFLDEWVSMKRLSVCCKLAECNGFIGGIKARTLGVLSSEIRRIPVKLHLTKQATETHPVVDVSPNTPALITFTTGSTGVPKAANRTHHFLNEQFKALLHEIEPMESDIDMVVLPIVLFVNLGVGCTSVIADFKMTKPNKIKSPVIAKQILTHRVNRVTASPFFIKKLALNAMEHHTPFLHIEKVFTGGAPVFPNEAKLYVRAFPHAQSTIVYGSTESEPISSIKAAALIQQSNQLAEGLPVGIPDANIALKVIKITDTPLPNCTPQELAALEVEPGEIGEIIVAGPHVLKQYYKNEAAFKANKICVDDTIWHRTADSGKMHGDQLFLHGRCAQLISYQNEIISPFIMENKIQSIEGVTMGTVMEIKGELVLAIESRLSKETLIPFLKTIPHQKVKILKMIPRDPRHNSKIDYPALKHRLA